MAQFKFSLANLLQLRKQSRDERRALLARAVQANDTLAARIEDMTSQIEAIGNQYRQASGPGVVAVDRLVEAQRYERVLASQRDVLRQQQQTVGDEVERRRAALIEADREVRVLEQLRDRRLARHRRESGRTETRILDEIATQRWSGESQ